MDHKRILFVLQGAFFLSANHKETSRFTPKLVTCDLPLWRSEEARVEEKGFKGALYFYL